MAKRRRNGFNEFIEGFNGTYNMGKKIAGDITDAQAGEAAKQAAIVTNPEDTATVQSYQDAAKGIADGTVGDAGMTPEERAAASAAYEKAAQTGTKFYLGRGDGNEGQVFDAMPTPQQQRLASMRAMGATYLNAGDQEKALKWNSAADQQESGIQQQELAGIQINNARNEEALKKKTADWIKNSNFGRIKAENEKQVADYQSAKAAYDARIQAGENPAAIGLPPKPPSLRTLGFAESINDSLSYLALEAEHGKYDPQKWGAMAEKMEKVKNESYDKALRLADSGAPIQKIADTFAESGKSKFDVKDVISDRMGTTMIRGVQVPTRIISIKGAPPIIVASELAALGDSEKILNTHFAVNQDKRSANADARAASSEARVKNKDAETKAKEKLRSESAVALFKEENPDASVARIEAVRNGVIPALPKERGFKIEMNEVATALGSPAVDAQGNPVVDFMTGRQTVNRNIPEERKFFKWMQDNNITDTNRGLAIYMANKGGGASAAGAKPKSGWGIKQIK